MKAAYLLPTIVLLAACTTVPDNVVYVPTEVKVPVSSPCRPPPIVKPAWAAEQKEVLKASAFDKVVTLMKEIEQRRAYEVELETALRFCTTI